MGITSTGRLRGTDRLAVRVVVTAALMLGGAAMGAEMAASRPGAVSASRPSRPDPAEVARAIQELGHPVPARREAATRQLAEWGTAVVKELERAAAGSNHEVALRARGLLGELRSLVLLGAKISLEVDRDRISWDEPISLTVVVENPSDGPIRIPRAEAEGNSTTRPADDEVAQVSAMMDLADYLSVTGPDGRQVDLRVDPIERDAAVRAAIEIRARGAPPTRELAPGRSAKLRIPSFNRGWARFPLLSGGRYQIKLLYQPQWKNQSWTQEGFGRVESRPVTVEVRQAAPEIVQGSGLPHRLLLRQADGELVAELQSMWDRAEWISLDFGSEPSLQARLVWRLAPLGRQDAEPITLQPEATPPDIHPERIQRLDPGRKLTVARVPLGDLAKQLESAGIKAEGRFEVAARYAQLAGAEQLRQELAGRKRKPDVPTHLFTGTATSNTVTVRLGEK